MRRFDFVRLFIISIVISHASALKSRGKKNFKKITIIIELSKKTLQWVLTKVYIIERVDIAQCGILGFFLSPRFYVKSILENLKVLKCCFFAILGARKFGQFRKFQPPKSEKFYKIHNSVPPNWLKSKILIS